LWLKVVALRQGEWGETKRGLSGGVGLGLLVYPIAVTTGFLAIGYEIIWFRIIAQLAKDSPYAFSSVLSVYLVGIAAGSFGMKKVLGRYRGVDRKSLLFALQFLI